MVLERLEKPSLSYEFYPPKKERYADELSNIVIGCGYNRELPSWCNITCGAGGQGEFDVEEVYDRTVNCVSVLRNRDLDACPHITCAGLDEDNLDKLLSDYIEMGIEDLFLVRGDNDWRPRFDTCLDLLKVVKKYSKFEVGVAGYPTVHPGSSWVKDKDILKAKQDAGADYIITQMCFDTDAMLHWRDMIRGYGISIPIVWGIMPLCQMKVVDRLGKLANVPLSRIGQRLGRWHSSSCIWQAGIDLAVSQMITMLSEDETHFHLYTMNRPDIAQPIRDRMLCYI